jgi:hypothetical protein
MVLARVLDGGRRAQPEVVIAEGDGRWPLAGGDCIGDGRGQNNGGAQDHGDQPGQPDQHHRRPLLTSSDYLRGH